MYSNRIGLKRFDGNSFVLTSSPLFFMWSLSACTHDWSKSLTITKSLYSQRNIWLVHATDDWNRKKKTIWLDNSIRRTADAVILEMEQTVSGPVTFVGGGIDRSVLRNSGPGLLLDRRFRAWDDTPILPNGLAAKSNPFNRTKDVNIYQTSTGNAMIQVQCA